LNVADENLCFGRIDTTDDRVYVGRVGLFDTENDYEPMLTDAISAPWRSGWKAFTTTNSSSRRKHCSTP
jgi:DNA helicase IV